jgi:hypothetical protein
MVGMTDRALRKRWRELTAQAKPCPRCGHPPEIDMGMIDGHPHAPGMEFFHCPWRRPEADYQTCGVHAQGLTAWNYQPLIDDLRAQIEALQNSTTSTKETT